MTTPMPTSDDERLNQRLSSFYSVLQAKLKPYRDAKQHLDRFLSTDFNVFKWIEPEKNLLPDQIRRFEILRSAIIADLLRDKGSHGQQRKFLDAFLQVIGQPDLKDEMLQEVGREVWIGRNSESSRGFMDILVKFNDFGLAIENKLSHIEQPDQLQRYYEFLNEKYGTNGFCLVYLTPDGRKPESIEGSLREELMNERKLICISYSRDMLKWLEECCRLCESDKFRWFLRDFMDYLNGGQTMAMRNKKEITLAHALARENLETALDINSAFNGELHDRIIVDFLKKLEEFVLEELRNCFGKLDEWEIDRFLVGSSAAHKTFGFKKKAWKGQYAVILVPQKNNACDFRIGVWREKSTPRFQPEDSLKQALDDTIGPGNNNDHWEWYRSLNEPYMNWNQKDALIKLYNGEAVEYLGQYLVNIIEVAAPIIDKHVRRTSS